MKKPTPSTLPGRRRRAGQGQSYSGAAKAAKKAERKTGKPKPVAVDPIQEQPRPTAYELYRQALEAPMAPPPSGTGVQVKSPEICAVFLEWLAKGNMPGVAAQKIGVSRTTVFNWKREDKEFAAAWEEAIQMGDDLLEQAIRNRAVEGYDRPVFQQGVMVGAERVYSDGLATMLLQGRRRGTYGKNPDGDDKQTTVTIRGGLPEGSTVTVHKGGKAEAAEDPVKPADNKD